jgi:hypothetical protein
MGPEEVARYNHSLVRAGAAMLAVAWGPGRVVVGLGRDGESAGMLAVQLPDELWLDGEDQDALNGGMLNAMDRSEAAEAAEGASGPTHGESESSDTALCETSIHADVDANRGSSMFMASEGKSSRAMLPVSPSGAAALNVLLRRKYKIEVPVACVGGALWVRVSAQIYNKEADYKMLAAIIKGMQGSLGWH